MFHTLADTQAGGGLQWIASGMFTLAATSLVAYHWMCSDAREAEKGDRRAEAGRGG